MRVRVVEIKTDSEAVKWDRFVVNHPRATGYHLTAWRHVVEKAFGRKTIYLMVIDGEGEVRGVLPLVFLSSKLFGRFLVSMPYLNYGGVLADWDEARDLLLRAAGSAAQETGAAHVELRQQGPELQLHCMQHKVSLRLPLPKDFDTL